MIHAVVLMKVISPHSNNLADVSSPSDRGSYERTNGRMDGYGWDGWMDAGKRGDGMDNNFN